MKRYIEICAFALLAVLIAGWGYSQQGLFRHYALTDTITVHADPASSTTIDMSGFATLCVLTPSGETGQDYEVYCSETANGTYVAYVDSDGNAVKITAAASRWQEIPVEIIATPFIRLHAATTTRTGITIFKKG